MYKNLIIDQQGTIFFVKINSPDTLNALNTQILKELDKVFDELEKQEEIRVVVLMGEGRAFVAGADIKEMLHLNEEEGRIFGELGARIFRKIEQFKAPVIAAVNGFALGGGCELAMACDIRIASDKAKFGQPEVSLGISPGFSGTQRLTRLVGAGKAKELIYTAMVISAEEALKIGLVNHVVSMETFMKEVTKMAETIAKQAPLAVSYAKKSIDQGFDLDIDEAIALENKYFAKCFTTKDQKNGMNAFVNKEKFDFRGK